MPEKDKKDMTNILLEAGTNELEIVEFSIGESFYGINVAKVREIIRFPKEIVSVPNSHDSLEGIINLRDMVVPIVNLPKHLGKTMKFKAQDTRIIISEFNRFSIGFWVDEVARIHRISWNQVEKPSDILTAGDNYVVAVIKMEEKIVLLLDYEKITADISPEAGMRAIKDADFVPDEAVSFDRKTRCILVAEDSVFIRNTILDYLHSAGYKTVAAANGQEAWDILLSYTKKTGFSKIEDSIQLVITDIEMPQVDGLHLIKNIKNNKELQGLPCVVFSSMISPELALKCKAVGAAAEITKPEINRLIALVDTHVVK
jgi:two-component system, chemotaxis family, chemotaxis protein CheV